MDPLDSFNPSDNRYLNPQREMELGMRNYNMELLSIAVQLGWHGGSALPALLVGVPGTGKTQTVQGMGKEFTRLLRASGGLSNAESFEVFTVALPQTGPSTIEGVMVPNEERTEVNRLPLAPFRKLLNAKYGLLFGDELSSAQDETGAAFMSLTQDGIAGDVRISNRIARVYAMNPSWCAASGRELSYPEANRFLWIRDWTVPVEDYIDYLEGGPGMLSHIRALPDNWEEEHGSITRKMLAIFLRQHPRAKNDLAKDVSDSMTDPGIEAVQEETGPWASERSWENAMRLCAAILSIGDTMMSDLARLAVEGCVGITSAKKWFEWLRTADFPEVEDMLRDPQGAQGWLKDQRSDRRKLQLEMVAQAAARKEFPKEVRIQRWNAAWEVIGPTLQSRRDDSISAVRILTRCLPDASCINSPWFVTAREIATDGININNALEKRNG